MPWFFAIPEFLKKRACRYLLQHYLGQFLEEKISLDDLTVDLYNGTGTITNVSLNVEAINEALEGTSAPIKVVSGYIGRVTVSVPWTALLKDSCNVEISGLALSIAPDVIPTNTDELDSLFFSMSGSSSMQLAEEVLKSGPFPGEEEAGNSPGFEGMEALARAIELVLAWVQVKFTDAVVQVNYRTLDYSQEYFLKIRMKSIKFFDEMSKVESSVDTEDEEEEELPQPAAITVKVLQLSGLTIKLGSTELSSARTDLEENFSDTLTTLSPPNFTGPPSFPSSQTPHSEDSHGVPIAFVSRDVTVRVKINQSETLPGPKLEVEGFVGSLHLLLSPQQLSMLLEMATGIANKVAIMRFSQSAYSQCPSITPLSVSLVLDAASGTTTQAIVEQITAIVLKQETLLQLVQTLLLLHARLRSLLEVDLVTCQHLLVTLLLSMTTWLRRMRPSPSVPSSQTAMDKLLSSQLVETLPQLLSLRIRTVQV